MTPQHAEHIVPIDGRMTDAGGHALHLRVRYAECDPMGVAHHSSYAPWLEMGRTELLRATGRTYEAMEREGLFLVITKLELKYRRPVKYDDLIEVRTLATPAGRVKIRHEYEVALLERAGRAPDAQADTSVPADGVCAVASTELACVNREGRPVQLPDWLVVS